MKAEITKSEETILVIKSQAGDREAFEALLRSSQVWLWRYIVRLSIERDLAEDILQNVFLLIYRKLVWLSEPALFRPWAYRIATRESFRELKKRRRLREISHDVEPVSHYRFSPEMIERLPEFLERVSPASRAVLSLHYLEDLSLNETAEVLDISAGTAKSRLAYGLATLRKVLKVQGK